MSGKAIILCLALLAFGCGVDQSGESARPVELELPRGTYGHLAWLSDEWIVSAYEKSEVSDFRLWAFRPDGSDFRQTPLQNDTRCRITRYSAPARLPDGRLGAAKQCEGPEGTELALEVTYIAHSLGEHRSERLATVIPIQGRSRTTSGRLSGDRVPEAVSWQPTLSRAAMSTPGLCSTVVLLQRSGYSGIPARISSAAGSWNLDDALKISPTESCEAIGRARYPTWSQGDEIAFFASPQVIGKRGSERASRPANLYIMTPDHWTPSELLSNIAPPSSLEWSPDGQWLAFAAGEEDDGTLWLYHVERDKLMQLTGGGVLQATWAPDGKRLALIRRSGKDSRPSQPETSVSILDVSRLVRS